MSNKVNNISGVGRMRENVVQNYPKALERKAVLSGLLMDFVNKTCLVEQWDRMDDTHLALEYDISTYTDAGSSADISSNLGYLTLTTDGSGTDKAGLATIAASIDPADAPDLECKVTLSSVAGVEHTFGFFKDANEYAYLMYDASAGANWLIKAHDGTTASSIDTGIAATTEETKLAIAIDTDGNVHAWIDDVYVDVFDLDESIQPATTTDLMKLYIVTQEEGAAAKISKTKYFQMIKTK